MSIPYVTVGVKDPVMIGMAGGRNGEIRQAGSGNDRINDRVAGEGDEKISR